VTKKRKLLAVDDHPLLREVRRALLLGAITAIALSGLPAMAQRATDTDTTLQEVIVTGSYIPRTDSETPSTVEIMTGADISNSGLMGCARIVGRFFRLGLHYKY
jgi:iron complex outermembrane recepter protein